MENLTKKMKPNAIYLRKSRSDPEDESLEETLSKHKEILLSFTQKNKLIVSEIYCEVVSGDGLFVRPEMIRLLNEIENGTYNAVICMDIDRLGRVDTKDRGIILEAFKDNDTKIITPQKTYDLNDEIDEFSTEMQMLFARQELKKITKRLRVGIHKVSEDGYHVGEPPYGYRRIYVDKKPTLEIHPDEAMVVKMIFDMYVNQHIGSHIIADRLNSLGYSPRKTDKFARNSVRWILQNPIYIGKIMYNRKHRVKKKKPTDKWRYEPNPQEQWIVSEGKHQAIIDVDTFEEAQRIRNTRSHPPSFKGVIENPFAGLIVCGNCGTTMLRQVYKSRTNRLLCPTTSCIKSATMPEIEERVLDTLKSTLAELKAEPKRVVNNSEKIEHLKKLISDCKKHLSILEQQKNKLFDLLEQEVYDVKTFTERSAIISQTITTASEQLADYEAELKKTDKISIETEVIPTLEYLIANYDNLSAPQKNMMLRKIVKRITYNRDKAPKSDFSLSFEFREWL